MKRRVVITGMGAITPLGHSVAEMFDAVVAGRSGVGPITAFNASRFPTKFAAQVKDFDLSRHVRDAARYGDSGHNCRFAMAASEQAMADAGLRARPRHRPARIGLYISAGEGINDFSTFISLVARALQRDRREIEAPTFARNGMREEWHAGREFELELHTTGGHLAEHYGLEGPNYVCLTACAASSQAIGEAAWQIRRGDAEIMLTGGSHSMIHPFGVTGFNRLTALSTNNANPQGASRPFDLNRTASSSAREAVCSSWRSWSTRRSAARPSTPS
jgi:3-oxoacyl-[acyl-carrier-protein] synthase II